MKRAIVREVIVLDEQMDIGPRGGSYKATPVHTLTAECGHVRIMRGFPTIPKTIICKDCKNGKAPVPVVGELGRFDRRRSNTKDPLILAMLGRPTT